jgi:hypothetical protein
MEKINLFDYFFGFTTAFFIIKLFYNSKIRDLKNKIEELKKN